MITLPEKLSIHIVSKLKESFTSELSLGQGLFLDANATQSLDAAGLQLLLAAHKHCTVHKLPWELHNWNPSLQKMCEQAGVTHLQNTMESI
jgi:anti-anti-sigma regulatory factor